MFEKNQKKENFTIIIGCGRLGGNLANTISGERKDVLVIDKDKEAFKKLSSSYGGLTMTGDATDMDVMLEAGIRDADSVVIVTEDDNVNICVSQMVKEMFGTPHVIARLYDSERKCVYRESGIDIICPAELSAKEVRRLMSEEGGQDL